MIKKLKIKFSILSAISILALLLVIVAGMNIINYNSVVKEADDVLSLLSKNKGAFPDFKGGKGEKLPPNMSPELPYESRYFSVLLNASGNVIQSETSRIASIDIGKAIEYAKEAANVSDTRGFIGNFRFVRYSEGNNFRITFLDCGRKLDSFNSFLFASISMAFIGFLIVVFVIVFFSGKIIRPIAESYEKQKRFITDAGHEIKTPLTIINANVDILEMELGQNECLEDIQQQTKRLTELTNNLVYLARMEEAENNMPMIEFPISEVVHDTAAPFKILAYTQNKEFEFNIQPMLSIKGNDKAIEQLVSILMDNALKYCPGGGRICLDLIKQNKSVNLTVFNTSATEISNDRLGFVFDRFYRTDLSRNSETGGYGIGLSIAKAIVAAHGGKIQASTKDGQSFQITASFPY